MLFKFNLALYIFLCWKYGQMKDSAEGFLQEKQLYSQLMSDCTNTLGSAVLRQDPVSTELRKEKKLTNEIRDVLQQHICILLNHLRSNELSSVLLL